LTCEVRLVGGTARVAAQHRRHAPSVTANTLTGEITDGPHETPSKTTPSSRSLQCWRRHPVAGRRYRSSMRRPSRRSKGRLDEGDKDELLPSNTRSEVSSSGSRSRAQRLAGFHLAHRRGYGVQHAGGEELQIYLAYSLVGLKQSMPGTGVRPAHQRMERPSPWWPTFPRAHEHDHPRRRRGRCSS
jgi:hypothetical protein